LQPGCGSQYEIRSIENSATAARKKLEASLSRDKVTAVEFLGVAYAPLQDGLRELGVEAVEDLKELEAEQIEQLAAKLTFVQAKKFSKNMAALQAE